MIKTVLITFLTKYCPEFLDLVDPHTMSTRGFLESLSYDISTTQERAKALKALTDYERRPGQIFSAAVSNFETLFTFFIQLQNTVTVEETNRLNLNNLYSIAPHLISRKYWTVILDWNKEWVKFNIATT